MVDGMNDGAGTTPGRERFERAEQRGPAVTAGAIGVALGVLGTAAVVNAPRIKHWWTDQAVPAAQSIRRKVLRQDGLPDAASSDASVILTRSTLRGFVRRVNVASGPDLIELLLAASIIADRMRTRSDDDLEAEAHYPDVSAAMARLASPETVDSVNRTLAAGDPPVDGETLGIFIRVFDGGHVANGVYVPVRGERVAGALRATRTAIPVPHRTAGAAETATDDDSRR